MNDFTTPHADRAAEPTYARAGLVAVLVCTPVAVFLVPVEFVPAGAMFLPGLILSLGLLAVPVVATLYSPRALFRVENLIMIGLVYWLLFDLVQGSFDLKQVERSSVRAGLVAVGAFAAMVWVAGLHRPWPLPGALVRAVRVEFNEQTLYAAIVVCAGLALFKFAYPSGMDPVRMFSALFGNRWSAPWGRGALGGWDAFLDHLSYFGYLLPTLTVLLAHRLRSWAEGKVFVSIVLTILVLLFIAHSGSRRVVGVTLGAALICWILLRGRALRLSTLLVPAVGCLMLLALMQMLLDFRGVGYGKMFQEGVVLRSDYSHLAVDDNFLRLAQTIELIPDKYEYTFEKVFIWVLIRPIPRIFWPDKPTDPGFNLTTAIGKKNVSLTCSVLGEFYMSFGWPAVLLGGWIYGRLAGMCNQFLVLGGSPVRYLLYAIGAMAVFAGLRSMLDMVLMSYMFLAWLGVAGLLKPADSPDRRFLVS